MHESAQRRVAILVFDDVEVLDFAGPYEVFSVAGHVRGMRPFRVRLVAAERGTVRARNDFRVEAHLGLDEVGAPDVLVIPGGRGTRSLVGDARIRGWIRDRSGTAEVVLSVCTGSLLLADAGLLTGRRATTHHTALDELRRLAPDAQVAGDVRWTDDGPVVTAAGVSAGIEGALHVVDRLVGRETARETARYIEYPWWTPSSQPHGSLEQHG